MVGAPRAVEVRDAVASGRATAVEVCRDALGRIAEGNEALNAFLTVAADTAQAGAAALDARADRARLPLAGVPVALKDNICTKGIRTTAGSRLLRDYVPPYSATVVERLEAAGAIVVGKTNCDEFAMGSSTEHSAFGPSRNPWALDRTPGGSSGGSAAAVAARLVPVALGSDTGGSIRQPAGFCGVVGFKPSYGRVSRYGLIAFASSLDQIGPFATSVGDIEAVHDVIAGADPKDATSVAAADDAEPAGAGLNGLRIGVPSALLGDEIDGGVRRAFDHALDVMRGAGAEVREITLPHAPYAIPVYYVIATAEASANLARYDGVRFGARAPGAASLGEMYDRTRSEGFGAEVRRRIILGTYVLSAGYYDAYYRKAQQVRTLIARDFEAAFTAVDLIALPTSPTPAFLLGERTDDPMRMYLADVFTAGASLAGLPAISLPCGFTAGRLPVGLQLFGAPMRDRLVLRAAAAYERVTSWTDEHPPIRRA